MNILIGEGRGETDRLRAPLQRSFPDADITRATTAAALDRLDQRRIDWLVVDSAAADLPANYFPSVHERAPDCSVVLLAADPLDDVVTPLALDVVVVRPAGDGSEALEELTRRIVAAMSPHSTDDPHHPDGHAPLNRLFAEHALPMLLIEPVTGAIIDANSAAVAFYGYTTAELTSMSIDDINALDDDAVADRRQRVADSTGEQFVFEHRTKSGELRTVEVNSTPIQYGGRTVLFSILKDITARVAVERRLRDATRQYQRLAEQNVAGIYVIEDQRFTYVNPKLAEIFGTTPAAMTDTSVFEYVAEADRDRVRARFVAREDGTADSVHYTFAGQRSDGEPLLLEAHGARLETADGVEIIGTLLDITARETQQRDLQRLSQALDHSGAAVYITNAATAIEYVNPAFERITGFTEAEALGETPAIISSGRMDDDYYRRLYDTLESGNVWKETVINRRKHGELYYAFQTIAPYFDDDGIVDGYVAVQSDITDERITQQILEVYQRVLRHNLRNKLTTIRGRANLLKPALRGTPLADQVEAIDSAATTLEQLSEKVRITRRALEFEAESSVTELGAVIEREVAVLEDKFPHATLTVEVPGDVYVNGAGRIGVCVREVIENAITHNDTTEPSVQVALRVDERAAMAELVVRDNGPGLPEGERTPIELGNETPLRHAEGIGLWLVNWVVTSQGGELEFADRDPRGLVVTLRLPNVEATTLDVPPVSDESR